jgi:DNA-binding MarR family transcriptional regulator
VRRDDSPALDSINRAVARLLRLNASRSAFARSAAAAGVSLSQPAYLLLRTVAEHGPLAVGRLAELSRMDVGMATREVAKLVEDGLVERRGDPTDGRVALVTVTRAGQRAGAALHAVRIGHLAASLEGWSARDLATFDRLLTRFVDDMAATSYASDVRA